MRVKIKHSADKELEKIRKSNPKAGSRINAFLTNLEQVSNPKALPNAKKLAGFDDDRWRWRVGEYRVIGVIFENMLTIEIIKIASRADAYE